jgi:hypothetical protein
MTDRRIAVLLGHIRDGHQAPVLDEQGPQVHGVP